MRTATKPTTTSGGQEGDQHGGQLRRGVASGGLVRARGESLGTQPGAIDSTGK